MSNILGAKFLLDIFSKNHVLYSDHALGMIQGTGLPDAKVEEYERKGLGIEGISYNEQIFVNQPWSMEAETEQAANRFIAIFTNQNPEDIEGEAGDGSDGIVGAGGSIGLTEKVDIILTQMDNNRQKAVKSIVYFKSGKNKKPVQIPLAGSSKVSMSGEAKRGYIFNKPVFKEGWQHDIVVNENLTSDAHVIVNAGPAWLRRTSGNYVPRKVYFKGASSAAFEANSTSGKYRRDALVLFETGMGYNNLNLAIIKGIEADTDVSAAPKSDSDIQTAIDIIDNNARWVRLVNVLITESTNVIIDNTNIESVSALSFSFKKTALSIPQGFKKDSFFLNNFVLAIWENGELKEDSINISGETSGSLTFSSTTTDMIEVCYLTEPYTYISPLKGS